MVAAGGGGDAITAAVLGSALGLTSQPPVVMTYAWDRLIIDPLPGSRGASEFTGLDRPRPSVHEILPTSRPIAPAGSTLPRLAAELPARLLLLDPEDGAVGMSRQITAVAELVGADQLAVVDVGGDILADGTEEGLRSPLADLLALAACSLVDLPARVVVTGAGLDGELSVAEVCHRVDILGGREIAVVSPAVICPVREIFDWHPSEASGLLALAAQGLRGTVEIRDAGCHVALSDLSVAVFDLDADVVTVSGLAARLRTSTTPRQAASVITEFTGIAELDAEAGKAARLTHQRSHAPTVRDLARIDDIAASTAARGAAFVSVRRLAELLGVHTEEHLAGFRRLLATERRTNYRSPVYDCSRPRGDNRQDRPHRRCTPPTAPIG